MVTAIKSLIDRSPPVWPEIFILFLPIASDVRMKILKTINRRTFHVD
jgi:hypothetical protein